MMPAHAPPEGGDSRMSWETPSFVEVKMDAEMTSYQDDIEEL